MSLIIINKKILKNGTVTFLSNATTFKLALSRCVCVPLSFNPILHNLFVRRGGEGGSLCSPLKNAQKNRIYKHLERHQNDIEPKKSPMWVDLAETQKTKKENRALKKATKSYYHYNLDTYHRSNQDTCLLDKPVVKEGDWVQSGDLLADSASSVGGELAIGHNIIVVYMPWEGYNYEDAILINQRLVYEDIYTSIHIERYEIQTKETKQGTEQITRDLPDISPNSISHLDKYGIARIGSWVEEGDILVGKATPVDPKSYGAIEKFLFELFNKKLSRTKDSSLRAPKGIKAHVINVNILNKQKILKIDTNSVNKTKLNKTSLKGESKKITTKSSALKKTPYRYGVTIKPQGSVNLPAGPALPFKNQQKLPFAAFPLKGTEGNKKKSALFRASQILKAKGFLTTISMFDAFKFSPALRANEHLHHQKSLVRGSRVSPKGTRTQKKYVEIHNVHVYLAEKRQIQVGDKMAGRHGNKGILSRILPRQDMPYLPDGTPVDIVLNPLGVPSRMNVGQIYECLLGLAGRYLGEHYKIPPFDEIFGADASRSFVLSKLYEARKKTGLEWLFDPNNPGKMRIFDGRTSDSFDQTVTVGIAYVLKLVHMVDDKMHMRSTGPYSLVTQQPLRGRSKQGGQRLGEMEVWAIEGYGAAFVLSEMLTIKSDNMVGRQTLWVNLINNKQISLGTPESFKVLVCELQALCLDIGLFRQAPQTDKVTNYQNTPQKNKEGGVDSEALIQIDSLLHLA